MIYDCFLFNDELDLLELRLRFLDDAVDRFVIVESERSLSGEPKPLHFFNNRLRFEKFLSRIIHLRAPVNDLPPWEYEFFQRNHIKEALKTCGEHDIIIISDADEIVNVKTLLNYPGFRLPALPEIPTYYYFFNRRSSASFRVNLIAPWSLIRGIDLGNRNENFPKLNPTIITPKQVTTGWHFSYLYGKDTKKYQQKIRLFSHQEYNTPYFLNENRIRHCVRLGIDLFERPFMKFRTDNKSIEPLLPLIKELDLTHLLYQPSRKDRLSVSSMLFILRKKYYPKFRQKIRKWMGRPA